MTSTPLLEARGIDKNFPGVRALDHVDFDLREGEVHGILGENGAGKSTLMKIISGSLPRDGGRIFMHGEEVDIRSPQSARDLGIGMVYQELSLIPTLSVAENIFLGRLPKRGPLNTLVDWPEAYSQAADILGDLGADIDPRQLGRGLSMAERQLTEIAKVLSMRVQVLLLDEPTSALSDEEREHLFVTIRRLQERGVAILYVSHRLAEVLRIGQRVTVLRDGRGIGSLEISEADEATLIRMMVGRELLEQFPKEEIRQGKEVLRIEGLTVQGKLQDISLSLHEGEILGVFGVMGAGRTDFARTLFGFERPDAGGIFLNGNKVTISSPAEAIGMGLGYMTEDRRDGLVPRLSIPPNITLASLDRITRLGFLKRDEEKKTAERYVQELNIATPSLDQKVDLLSGGNQQKVALAKWLCSESKILILDEPTRGIDVGAKVEVYRLMNNLAKEGVGIVMISSELPEVVAMADRILVMSRGRIAAEYARGECTQEDVLRCAVE